MRIKSELKREKVMDDLDRSIEKARREDPHYDVLLARFRMYREWGEAVRKARLIRGLSQSVLAKRAGTTQAWLSKFENAETIRPDLAKVQAVLDFLRLELVVRTRRNAPLPR